MEEMSATIVPLGSLALIFAVISILVFLRKASIARQADESIKNRMEAKRNEKTESLEEQKKRLELLLKKLKGTYLQIIVAYFANPFNRIRPVSMIRWIKWEICIWP